MPTVRRSASIAPAATDTSSGALRSPIDRAETVVRAFARHSDSRVDGIFTDVVSELGEETQASETAFTKIDSPISGDIEVGKKDKYFAKTGTESAIESMRELGFLDGEAASLATDDMFATLSEKMRESFDVLVAYQNEEAELSEEEVQHHVNVVTKTKDSLRKLAPTYIVKKQDALESFVELTSGMVARHFLGNKSPKYRLAESAEAEKPPVLTAKFLRNYKSLRSKVGKTGFGQADLDAKDAPDLSDAVATSIFIGDFDWHPYNLGVVLDDHGEEKAARIDYGLSTAFFQRKIPSVQQVDLSIRGLTDSIRSAKKTVYSKSSRRPCDQTYTAHELLVDVCRTRSYKSDIYRNERFVASLDSMLAKDPSQIDRVIDATMDYQERYFGPEIFTTFLDYQEVAAERRTDDPKKDVKAYLKHSYAERRQQMQDLSRNIKIELAIDAGKSVEEILAIALPEGISPDAREHNIKSALSYALFEGKAAMVEQASQLATEYEVDLESLDKLYNNIENAQLVHKYHSEINIGEERDLSPSLKFLMKQRILADRDLSAATKDLQIAVIDDNKPNFDAAIAAGADVNALGKYSGMNALHLASYFDNSTMIKKSHEAGADLKLPNAYGLQAVHLAALFHNEEAYEELVEGLDVSPLSMTSRTPRKTAIELAAGNVRSNFFQISVDFDLDTPLPKGHTLLTSAMADGNLEQVKELLVAGAKPNVLNGRNANMMYYLAGFKTKEARDYFIDLALKGADITVKAHNGKSPLDVFIEFGGDLNMTNQMGHSFLSYAVITGNVNLTEKLLKAGADPNTKSPSKEYSVLINHSIFEGIDEAELLEKGLSQEAIDSAKEKVSTGKFAEIPAEMKPYQKQLQNNMIAVSLFESGAALSPALERRLPRINPYLAEKFEEISSARSAATAAETAMDAGAAGFSPDSRETPLTELPRRSPETPLAHLPEGTKKEIADTARRVREAMARARGNTGGSPDARRRGASSRGPRL
ncbi:MAG: hypothetical protein RLN62_05710 [Rickettsiales bacterium]